MRYRLMASYLGASYQAAVGPSDRDVTLFAAPPPPEEHGFSPAPGGIWRKQVRLDDLDALWESRPIGSYHGEPCLVLDDLGDRLHIVYLGMDERRAAQLGYWEVDRGVFEVVVLRHDVTDLAEERHEFPISLLLSALPRALSAGDSGGGPGVGAMPASIGPASGLPGPGPGAGGRQVALNPAAGGGWNGQATAQPAVRGQLPPAGSAQLPPGTLSQPPAAVQHPAAYQNPAPGLPAGAGMPQPPGTPPMLAGPRLPMGQQAPGMQQAPVMRQALGPEQNGPGAQPQAAGAAQQGVAPQSALQPGTAQPFTGAAPLPPAPLPSAPLPAVQQAPALPAVQQQAAPLQPGGSAQTSQPPAAAAAWHGSPAPDGSGTWYYQSAYDPQRGGVAPGGFAGNGVAQSGYPQQAESGAQNGYAQQGPVSMQNGYPQQGQASMQNGYPQQAQGSAQNGYPQQVQGSAQNGYPQPDQDVAGNTPPGGQAALPRYAPAGGTGYQQAAPLAVAAPQQAQQPPGLPAPGLPAPGQPTLAGQSMPVVQPPQVTQAASLGQQTVQAVPQTTFPPVAAAAPVGLAAGTAATGVSDSGAMTALGQPQAFGQQAPATASPLAPQVAAPPAPAPSIPAPVMPGAPQVAPLGTVSKAAAAAPAVEAAPGMTLPPSASVATQAPVAVPAPAAVPAPVAMPTPLPTTAAPQQGATTGPQTSLPGTSREQSSPIGAAAGALSKLTGAVRGRRAARKPRLAMSAIFADLVDMADIPRSAYAVDEEVTGAMCLFKTDGGYEVFSCAEDARHEVRFFEDEEAAYFYLFGVLAAEALRNGRLSPRRG